MSTNATHTQPPRGGIHPGWLVAAVLVAVVALGGLAWALLAQGEDEGSGDEQDAADPTNDPGTPSPDPSSTPGETSEPGPAHPLIALTAGGDVVRVDPRSGSTETLLTGLPTTDPAKTSITVGPDGEQAYVSHPADGDAVGRIQRVTVANGTAETVASGINPSVSPDGRTLAYVGDGPGGLALILRDLASGEERTVPAGFDGNPAAWLGQAAWSRDSARLYVPRGLEGSNLFGLDADAATFDDATVLGDGTGESHPVVLPDGTLLVFNDVLGATAEEMYVSVLDTTTGEPERQVEELSGVYVADMSAHPDDDRVALLIGDRSGFTDAGPRWDLHVWEVGGELRLLAEDLVAVGW